MFDTITLKIPFTGIFIFNFHALNLRSCFFQNNHLLIIITDYRHIPHLSHSFSPPFISITRKIIPNFLKTKSNNIPKIIWISISPSTWLISMKKHHHKTSISTIFIFFLLLHLQPTISDPNDEACLTQLYASFQDPNQSLKNWTQSNFANPCNGFDSHLQGATCNNGRIYRLSLSSLKLRGTISPSLSKCNNLQTLDLSSNQLSIG